MAQGSTNLQYPTDIDQYTTYEDDIDICIAKMFNDLSTSIIAVETELGTNPSGSYATVKARFEAIDSLGSGYVKANGTIPLNANWDVGSYKITALQFESDVTTGTAPFVVASTTVVTNLNADTVDGIHGTDLIKKNGTIALTDNWDVGAYKITALQIETDIVTGTAPLIVASTTVVTNLNSDTVDGIHGTDLIKKNGTVALTDNWDVGAYKITALQLESDIVTGTAPLIVASTTVVTNLNADTLDGKHANEFGTGNGDLKANGTVPLTDNWDVGSYKITALQFESDIVTGTAPLVIASTTVVTNLNSDTVDGIHGTDLIKRNGTVALTDNWNVGAYSITSKEFDVTSSSNVSQTFFYAKDSDSNDQFKAYSDSGGNGRVSIYNTSGVERIILVSNDESSFNGGGIKIKDASANSGATLKFLGSNTQKNYLLANQQSMSVGFEITPSTANGGTTFTTPDFTIVNSKVGIGLGTTAASSLLQLQSTDTYLLYLTDTTNVAHGMTTIVPTDVYGGIGKITTDGGLIIKGLTDTGGRALLIEGIAPTLTSNAPVTLRASKTNGTGAQVPASTDLAFVFENYGATSQFITILGSGNTGVGVASPAEKLEVNGNIKCTNIINTLTVGETVAIGDCLYIKSDGYLWKADADAESTGRALFIALEAKNASQTCKVVTPFQIITNGSWSWGTVGGAIYVSTTAGGLTQTAPSGSTDVVVIMGFALSATQMILCPGYSYVELT